jgi:uncharacterized membrane protein/ribosomal protein L40E
MSLESGRKLGLTASLINVIVPIVTVALYGFFLFSLISTITNAITGGGSTPIPSGLPFLSLGIIWIAFVAVGIISFVGLILFIVAMHQLSQYYNEPIIFRNIIYSLVISIVGAVALTVALIAILFAVIASTLMNTVVSTPTAASSFVWTFIIALIVVSAVAIAIGVVSALLYKRAFNKLAEKSGVHSFDTAGLLILIGVFIPIVSWVGWIFAASGFNALKPKPYSPMPTAPTITTQIKFCLNCGMANNVNAAYCKNCGKKLP